MNRVGRSLLVVGLVLVCALLFTPLGAVAHVRLHNPSNKAPLFWQSPESIGIVINSAGSDDISDGSVETSIRSAIAEWNSVGGTTMQLVENEAAAQQAREDWEADDIHLVYFDEDNSSGYFPTGSGTVAITPVWFFSSGKISDADILFNGSGFNFTTSKEPGRFDVEDVATHELGHLLGLDHSGWAGGTMYPFVDPAVILHRSLSLDEIVGIRDVYPNGNYGVLRGRVLRQSDASPVAGAHVVARTAEGRTAGGTLAGPDGVFLLRGLSPGSYEVYATPLDEPVSSSNLTSGHEVDIDFESGLYAGLWTVSNGSTTDLGDLSVGDDVNLNLGRSFDRYPRRIIAGLSSWIIIRGTGLTFGSTLESSDPEIQVLPLDWVGFQVNFQVIVPPGTQSGHIDLTVTDPFGRISILPAALEITPPSPVVSTVSPDLAGASGGTRIDVSGSGFRAGCRVVIGDHIYNEGADGDVELVDDGLLRVTLRQTVMGRHDAVVVDASGVEGRMTSAVEIAAIPRIDSIFPRVGTVEGGTTLIVSGADFLAGATATLGGIAQGIEWIDSERLEVTTAPGMLDGEALDLEVVNPGGFMDALTAAFEYVEQPDPVLSTLAPGAGPAAGGEEVELRGANLNPGTIVRFGVDPETGEGGIEAETVDFEDATMLRVVTPSHPAGEVSVLAYDPATGQQALLTAAFTYTAPSSGGGGGCGSIAPGGVSPSNPARGLANGAWMLVLALLLRVRKIAVRRSRRLHPAASAPVSWNTVHRDR